MLCFDSFDHCAVFGRHNTRQRILQLVKDTSAKLKSLSESDRDANANVYFTYYCYLFIYYSLICLYFFFFPNCCFMSDLDF